MSDITLCGRPSTLDPDLVDRWVAWASGARLLEAGVAQRVRTLAVLATQGTVSGQALSRRLGVSRAAVHKYVDVLRGLGVKIGSAPGTGYSLAAGYDGLAPEVVLALAFGLAAVPPGDARFLGLPYAYLPAVGSTNAALQELVHAGARSGAVAVTDEQVAGRGRLGRTWVSERGKDVTFSVALRPDMPAGDVHRLVLAASVAVAETLGIVEGLAGRVRIKWPNDVLLDGRKVCGILSDASMDMDRVHWVIIGVGLNVNSRPAEGPRAGGNASGRPVPASVAEVLGQPVPRGLLLACLLGRLQHRLSQAEDEEWPVVRAAYEALDALAGSPVTVRTGLGESIVATGVGCGIGEGGELLLEQESGDVVPISSGEVTLAPPPDGRQEDA